MNVLISGAARGLGSCLCKRFLREGHKVFAGVLSTDMDMDLKDIEEKENLIIVPLDVSKKESMEEAKKIIQTFVDRIDVLINVAGVLLNRKKYIISDSYEDIELTFKVNTIGPVFLNNLFMENLQKSQCPTIINISSEVLSIDGVGAKFGTYCMSKTAIAQYGFIMRETMRELNWNIRVFSVHPGRMNTIMGAENAQIEPEESADGIYQLAVGNVLVDSEVVYVNYKGQAML